MNNSVKAIDSGLADVEQTATEMNAQMQSMVTTSGESVETMQDLEAQLGAISQSMVALAAATEQLTAQMNSIQQSASSIAANGTKDALAETQKINRALPATVPPPQLEGAPQ
jgi:prefoldin subunit 5